MRNIWKRSLSMLLALVLVLGMVPGNALAAVSGSPDTTGDPYVINVGPGEAEKISESELYAWLGTMYGEAYEGISAGGYRYTGGSVSKKNIRDTALTDPSSDEGSAVLTKDILYTVEVAYYQSWSVKWRTETKQFRVVEAEAKDTITLKTESANVPYNFAKNTEAQVDDFRNAIIDAVIASVNNGAVANSAVTVKFHHLHTGGFLGIGDKNEYLELNAANAPEYNDTEDKNSFEISYGNAESVNVAITLVDSRTEITTVYSATAGSNNGEAGIRAAAAAAVTDVTISADSFTLETGWADKVNAVAVGETAVIVATASFAGNETYQPADIQVNVTVTKNANPSTVTVESAHGTAEISNSTGVIANGGTSYAGELTIRVDPADEGYYYVESVTVSDGTNTTTVTGTYNNTVFTGTFEIANDKNYTVTVNYGQVSVVAQDNTVKVTGWNNNGWDYSYRADGFKAVLTTDNFLVSAPEGGSLTVQMNTAYGWQNVSLLNEYTSGAFLDVPSSKQIRILWTSNDEKYPNAYSNTVTATIEDSRTLLTIGGTADVLVYGASSTTTDIENAAKAAAGIPDNAQVTFGTITVPSLSHEEAANVTVTITVTADLNYQAATGTVTVPVIAQEVPSTLEVEQSGDGSGTVTIKNGDAVVDNSQEADLSITVDPADDGSYILSVIIKEGEAVIEQTAINWTGAGYTANFHVESNSAYTVEVIYGKRSFSVAETGEIAINGHSSNALSKHTGLKDKVLAAALGEGYDASLYTVELLGSLGTYNVESTNWTTVGAILAVLNVDAELTFRVTWNSEDTIIPAVSDTIAVTVSDSRPKVTIDYSNVEAITDFNSVADIEGALEDMITATYDDGTRTLQYVDVNVTVTSQVDLTAAADGKPQTVTYTVSVGETASYLGKTEEGKTVEATGQVHNSTITVTEAENAQIQVNTDLTNVVPGTYTVTVTPNSSGATNVGYYVETITVNGEAFTVEWNNNIGTATFTTVNGDSAPNTYVVAATTGMRTLDVTAQTPNVYYNPLDTALTEAVLLEDVYDKTVNIGPGYAAGVVTYEGELGAGSKTFTITWTGDAKYPTLTASVTVNLNDTREQAMITAGTIPTLEVDGTLDGVADYLMGLEGGVVFNPAAAGIGASYVLAAGQTAPASGETKTVYVTVAVNDGINWLANSAAIPVTVTGKAYPSTVTVTENADHGEVTIVGDNVGGYMDETLTITVDPAAGYYVAAVTVNGEDMGDKWDKTNYIFELAVGYAESYQVAVTYAEAKFNLNEDNTLTFYHGINTPDNETVYETVIKAPAYSTGNVSQILYLAREAGTYAVTLPKFEIFGYPIDLGTIDIELPESWLPITEELESETIDKALADAIASIDYSDIDWREALGQILQGDFSALIDPVINALSKELDLFMCDEFGYNPTNAESVIEELHIIYTDNVKVIDEVVEIVLLDDRDATVITGTAASVVYGEYTAEDLLAAIKPVITATDYYTGEQYSVTGDVVIVNAAELIGVNVGQYTAVLSYAGSDTCKPITAEVAVTVNKASCQIDYDSQVVVWSENIAEAYDFTLSNPKNVNVVEFMIGIDLADGMAPYVQLKVPSIEIPIFGDYSITFDIPEGEYTLSELKEYIGAMSIPGLDEIITMIEEVQGEMGLSDMLIKINGKIHPNDIGLYLAGAVTVDQNYETAFTVDYLMVVPAATESKLEWVYKDTNGVFTPELLQYQVLGAKGMVDGTEVGDITEGIKYVFLSVTVDAEGEMVFDLIQADAETVNSVAANGAYTQMAYYLDWGNSFYYAVPIVRAFVIVPNILDVEIVDGEGSALDVFEYEFDNTAKEHYVSVDGEKVEVQINYVGLQTNTNTYNSTEAPKHAGAYAAYVTYLTYDDAGNLTGAGFDAAVIVIKPTQSAITVEDKIAAVQPGVTHVLADQVTAGSTVAGLKPDTTIISASLGSNGTYSENGWEAITGNVNVDFPAWVDKLIAQYAPSVVDGITVAQFGEKLVGKLPGINAELEAMGISAEIIDALNAAVNEAANVLAQVPGNVTLSVKDNVTVSNVGAYLIIGVVTDSDHIPAMDTGILVVTPNVSQVELKWNHEDDNNVWTKKLLSHVDLYASAYDAQTGELNEAATGKITYQFITIDENGDLVICNSAEQLSNGVYMELAYIQFEVDGQMYISDMIARMIVLTPDAVNVNFHDGEKVNNDRLYTYDGAQHDMGNVVITELDGTAVDTDKGELTVTYVGVMANGEIYNSAEAPTDAGVYTVTVTYIEYDEEGEVYRVGSGIGALVVEKAPLELDLEDTTVTWDGSEHFVDVTNIHNGDYVTVIVNRADNTANIIMEDDLAALLELIQEELETEIPNTYDVAEVLAAVNGLLADAEELNAQLPEEYESYGAELLAELKSILAKLPQTGTVTVNGSLPAEIGTYECYALAYSDNYKTEVSRGYLEIVPVQVKIEIENASKYYGQADPDLADTVKHYDHEGNELADAGIVSVELNRAPGQNVGKYAITATVTNADEKHYEVITVTEDAVLEIKPAEITVTVNDQSKVYGQDDPALTYHAAVSEGKGVIGSDLVITLDRVDGEDVGTYAITATVAENANYKIISNVHGVFTIEAKQITLADVALNGQLTYNGTEQTQAITVTEGITYDVSGNTGTNAGGYTLTVTGNGNYTGEVKLDWTVAKAEVKIELNDIVIDLDDEVPALVEGENYTVTNVKGQVPAELLQLAVSVDVTKNAVGQNVVGVYEIKAEYVESDNWTVSINEAKLTVELGDYVCWNMQTGVYYPTAAQGLMTAEATQVVQMLKNSEEAKAILAVISEVTLDLNGCQLTCYGLAAFNGNHVVDTSENTAGLLIVPRDNLTLAPDNQEVPIWNENNGYVFVTPNTSAALNYQYFEEITSNSFYFEFRPGFGYINGESVRSTYFATNGGADNGLTMILRLTWVNGSGQTVHQNFVYEDAFFYQAYQSGQAFFADVTGTGAIGEITINAVIVSDSGVEFAGEAATYSAAVAANAE